MKFKQWISVLVFIGSFSSLYSQNVTTPIQAFKLQRIGGEMFLDGYYNYRTWNRLGITDNYRISYISPTFNIKTQSYIGHPNLLTLNVKADYNPELRNNIADIHPDRVERMSHKGIDLSANLLKNKKIRLQSNVSLSDGYYNDEDINYTKSNNKYWDVKLMSVDKRIPFQISYSNLNSENNNITSDRLYSFDSQKIVGTINKTFFKNDAHRFQYKYTDDNRVYSSLQEINTIFHDIHLNNRLFLDTKNNLLLNSTIREYIKYGNQESQEFSVKEKLDFKLPLNLQYGLNYIYRNYSREEFSLNQNNIFTHLDHKLFKSLRSSVFYGLNNSKRNYFDQQIYQAGFSFNYIKKIPTGNVSIKYYYANENMDNQNKLGIIEVVNEQHTISDGEIVLLENPYVNKQSIVVKSMNQILIYQENLDYYLIDQGDFVEIQRIPGGQIDNNSVVYIDYTANQPSTSSYNLNRHNFSAEVSVLNQLISVYYRFKEDAYKDISSDFVNNRDEYTQHLWGIKSRSKYHKVGVEYNKKTSSLIPLEQLRSYANLRFKYKKINFFANASYNYYYKYGIYKDQSYVNLSANAIYLIGSNSRIEYNFNYRKQSGDNIFLDLTKSKLEFSSGIRALNYSVGVEYFHKNLLLDKTQLLGVFVKVTRRF